MSVPLVTCFDFDANRVWETSRPADVKILARFGAEESTAKVALHSADSIPSGFAIGYGMEIRLDGVLKFRGNVSQLRTDSLRFPLVVQAARRPRRTYPSEIRKVYENASPTDILADVLTLLTVEAPTYSGTPVSTRNVDRVEFSGSPFFYAVDLLAKLAGNWLWWIDWEEGLHFIPPDSIPDHVWCYDADRIALHPWSIDKPVKNRFVLLGGVTGGAEFVRFFENEESREKIGAVEERLYVRPITTEPAYVLLRDAVLEEAPWPGNFEYLDRLDGDLSASFGETIELRGNPLLHVDEDQVYRIAAEEIHWSPETLSARYHLAAGLESASRDTRYIDHDPQGSSYVASRLGPFTLDLSALDSEAHLDN